MNRQPVLKGMELWAVGCTALAAMGSLYWGSERLTLGVMTGGLLMAANLWVIRLVVQDLLGEPDEKINESRRKSRKTWLLFQYVLKMAAILGAMAGLLKWQIISPAGLLVGIAAAITALLVVGLRAAAFGDEGEDDDDDNNR